MFNSLKQWPRPSSQARRQPVRKARSLRLGVESLETRELLASSLTASLSGGLLRIEGTNNADTIHLRRLNNQISVDGITIQTGGTTQSSVAASSVSQIDLRSLSGNDQVWLGDSGQPLSLAVNLLEGVAGDTVFTSAYPAGATFGSAVTQAAATTDGNLDALFAGGNVMKWSGTSWNLWVGNVQSFSLVPDGSGDVYALYSQNNQNSLYCFHRAGGCNNLGNGVQTFAVGPSFTGNASPQLYILYTDGRLTRYDGSYYTMDTGVSRLILGPSFKGDGSSQFYLLHTDGRLTRYDGSYYTMDNGVSQLVLGLSQLYILHTSGSLTLYNGSYYSADVMPVQAIAPASPSSIFDLHKDGNLIKLNADGTSALYDVNPVQAIAPAAPGSIFDLHKDGNLIKLNADGTSALYDVNPVQAIAPASPSSIFDLHKDGNLIKLNADGTSALYDVNPVQAIAPASPSSIFDLHKDGNLIKLNADGTSALYDVNPVQAIAPASPSSIFDLHKDGNLIKLNADGTSALYDVNPVQAIAPASPSSIFDLHKDGNLIKLNADGTSALYDVNPVQAIAQGVGNRTIALTSGGKLYTFDGVNTGVDQGVSGVTALVQGFGNQGIALDAGRLYTFDGVHNWVDQGVSGVTALVQGIGNQAIALSAGRLYTFDGVHNWIDQGVSGVTALVQGFGNQGIALDAGRLYTFDGVHNWVDQGVGGVTAMAQGANSQAFLLTTDGRVHTFDGVHNWVEVDQFVATMSTDATRELHLTYTPIGQKWHDLGGATGPLGRPTSDEQPTATGGRVVNFQHGAILWTSATGATALFQSSGVPLANGASALLSGDTVYSVGPQGLSVIRTGVQALTALGNGNAGLLSGGNLYAYGVGGLSQVLTNVQGLAPVGTTVQVQVGPYLRAQLSAQVDPNTGTATLSLTHVQLDLGTFLGNYVGPLVREIQQATMPLEHTAESLLARIPVLSDISNRFGGPNLNLADLMGAATGTSAVRDFATAIEAINGLDPNFAATGTIDLGNFSESATVGGSRSVLVSQAASFFGQLGADATAYFQRLEVGAGFHLAVLDDPTNLFRVLAGQNVTLFTYTPPGVNLDLSSTQRIAYVPVLGPVGFDVLATEEFHAHAGLTLGLDSSGLLAGDALAGFFVQNAGLNLSATFTLSGYVGVPDVIEAGISGSLTVNIGATLSGADGNGTVTGRQLAAGTAGVVVSGAVSGGMALDFRHISVSWENLTDIWGLITGQKKLISVTTEHVLSSPQTTFWTF